MKLRNIFASLLAIGTICSCSSFLDVTPPNSITDEQIKDLMENGSDATKEKIMTGPASPPYNIFENSDQRWGKGKPAMNNEEKILEMLEQISQTLERHGEILEHHSEDDWHCFVAK